MGPTFILVTTKPVSKEDLQAFILSQGGAIQANGVDDGRVTSPDACVNIKWDEECDADWTDPIEPFDSSPKSMEEWREDLTLREELRTKLGGEPSACIILDLFRGQATQKLAWSVIQAMFQAWAPCVLRSYRSYLAPEQEIWTLEELKTLWAAENRLPY